jgi:2-C-methyl-D-erythritol 4-phosphate cytidylyltransferase/2-C-methyl-D-erythritol 2,4-cyclodiphosphate synthase
MVIGGVVVDETRGLIGTSDGDVALHAVTDAAMGAAAMGDMGTMFPSDDPKWSGADSAELLTAVVRLIDDRGMSIQHVDVTIIAETVRINPHRAAIRQRIAQITRASLGSVSVKAKTTDGMGFIGRDEGIAATAVVALDR